MPSGAPLDLGPKILELVCSHTKIALLRDQSRLSVVHKVLREYTEIVRASAEAVSLVAEDTDLWVYNRVGEEFDLAWDFSDPEAVWDLSARLEHVVSVFDGEPLPFSSSGVACVCKSLAKHVAQNKKLERKVTRLQGLSDSLCQIEFDVRDAADLLEAAAEVYDFQLQHGIPMRIGAICEDGVAVIELAFGLRLLADAVASLEIAVPEHGQGKPYV